MSPALAGLIGGLGLPELIIILVIVLLLFGSTKIPQIMRGMGQGIGEFKKGIKEGNEEPPKPEPPPAEKK
ncbi:MAG TPA: twin-arginine translocase TatA/TatE family subunit [Planctomycetota bacterium]|nr:twin-arginine translocase TatA/TatE family subunit [Planctomycetota bacterium]